MDEMKAVAAKTKSSVPLYNWQNTIIKIPLPTSRLFFLEKHEKVDYSEILYQDGNRAGTGLL